MQIFSVGAPCVCEVCVHRKEFVARLQAVPVEHHEFFENLYDRWAHTDMDADYWEAKAKGEWPDGEQERADYAEDRKGARAFEYLMWELQKVGVGGESGRWVGGL